MTIEKRHGPHDRRARGNDPVTNDDLDEALAIHADQDRAFVMGILDKAFPDGAEAHGEYHRKVNAAAKAEEEFWRAAKMKLLEHGLNGVFWVFVIVAGLALAGLATKLGIPIPK